MGFFVKHVLAGYEVTVERQRANAPLNYSASGAAFMVSQRDTFRSKRSPRVARTAVRQMKRSLPSASTG
ncbi:hypothetical protein ABIE65_005243 [Constrictibacter sp. MBR-5]|jgi:hypothetical protein|uniref:hypothetical protein n=1 Tax=Constrictibacter sp. MBR-5 TaxID=3156467 RepID=UPI003394C72F